YVPSSHQLARFGGNMSVARGTTYGLRDAWTEFYAIYRDLWLNTKGFMFALVMLGVLAALILSAVRRGWQGAITGLVAAAVAAILAGMLLPALAQTKARSARVAALNNLQQIGRATVRGGHPARGGDPQPARSASTGLGSWPDSSGPARRASRGARCDRSRLRCRTSRPRRRSPRPRASAAPKRHPPRRTEIRV